MKQNLEIEFKSMLSSSDFNRLKSGLFKNAKLSVQENLYFDTKQMDLAKQMMSARIRKVHQKSLFTLKQVNDEGHILEHEVEDEHLEITDPRIQTLLNNLNLPSDLQPISQSLTYRYKLIDEQGEWCLDQTEFRSSVDFELEFELTNPTVSAQQGLESFLNFLEAHSIVYVGGPSKFVRSLENRVNTD